MPKGIGYLPISPMEREGPFNQTPTKRRDMPMSVEDQILGLVEQLASPRFHEGAIYPRYGASPMDRGGPYDRSLDQDESPRIIGPGGLGGMIHGNPGLPTPRPYETPAQVEAATQETTFTPEQMLEQLTQLIYDRQRGNEPHVGDDVEADLLTMLEYGAISPERFWETFNPIANDADPEYAFVHHGAMGDNVNPRAREALRRLYGAQPNPFGRESMPTYLRDR